LIITIFKLHFCEIPVIIKVKFGENEIKPRRNVQNRHSVYIFQPQIRREELLFHVHHGSHHLLDHVHGLGFGRLALVVVGGRVVQVLLLLVVGGRRRRVVVGDGGRRAVVLRVVDAAGGGDVVHHVVGLGLGLGGASANGDDTGSVVPVVAVERRAQTAVRAPRVHIHPKAKFRVSVF